MDQKPTRPPSFVRRERTNQAPARRDRTGEPPLPAPVSNPAPTHAVANNTETHTRIVIPRQQRTTAAPATDIELREVRLGASGTPYLRVVPRRSRLKAIAPGHIEATSIGSQPATPFGRITAAVRRVVIGSPYATSRMVHERLSKLMALPVFASDALSSSAYATEEILLVLLLAGTGAFNYSIPIALSIGLLLTLVAVSYRQTIKAYPNGGGAYIVSRENLGKKTGLIAASALLVDYVLTVAVSVAAGVAAVTSAAPDLVDFRVLIAVGVVAVITLGNLRGVRESGAIFAIPTYCFIFAMVSVLVIGFARVILGDAPGSVLHAAPPAETHAATEGLTLFLVLKAFSSGCAALTGIEAISNGVPAFKAPESDNARKTLAWMAVILLALFLGITFLASRFGLVPDHHDTIVSQLGKEILGQNAAYYGYQAATALVLFLAANTAYADFPRLSAILARDGYMPRQFTFRGDRLAFSNGILLLAVAAAALLAIFGATVNHLIPLYAVGVFVSFTLSQVGMVRHWLRLREPGWRSALVVNAVGATGTGVVAVIIAGTKFLDGAWLSILAMGVIAVGFSLIAHHYEWFRRQVSAPAGTSLPRGPSLPPDDAAATNHVIVPVDDVNRITLGAVAMAREVATRVTAVHLTDDRAEAEEFRERWQAAVPDINLVIVESPYRAFVAPMLAFVESAMRQDPRVTVVLPGFVVHRPWQRFLHNRDVGRLRPHLQRLGVPVLDYRFDVERAAAVSPPPATAPSP